MSGDDFSAVSLTVEATNFEPQSSRLLMLALAVIIGGIAGVVYVLISTAVRQRKEQTGEA